MVSSDWTDNSEENQELSYYLNEKQESSRGFIPLKGALVSVLTQIKEQQHAFSIQVDPPSGKKFFLAAEDPEEAEEWRVWIYSSANLDKLSKSRNGSIYNKSPPRGEEVMRKSFGGNLRSSPEEGNPFGSEQDMFLQGYSSLSYQRKSY